MESFNQTTVNSFILLGLSDIPSLQVLYFVLFLAIYTITLTGNLLLIIVVRSDNCTLLCTFFLLTSHSLTLAYPQPYCPRSLLIHYLRTKILFLGCVAQMFVSLVLGAAERMLLAVMAYDRYMAICFPLNYSIIMSKMVCASLAGACWVLSFISTSINASFTFRLPYCKSNQINHFFCEIPPLLRLSCKDTLLNVVVIYVTGGMIALCSFLLTVLSYGHIILTILKIRSKHGRYKTFSTCASHLTVVCLFYGTIMFMYLRPRSSYSPDRDRAIAILYTVVTPMLNPIIYSIKNKENPIICNIKNKEAKGTLRNMKFKK
ncbi:hypothetical protein XELAEV_18040414mg [Xenopus laevis]|uniref:G-protein coupled receptors family 1 profile domain-containing protein n=1 Tax=Xenopus laevis TaxID=8355 RepID=A0A974CAM0_XENLA|nr:hypothetical protein XELAEV_18040414mg [Xenopus laevis]